MLNKEVTVRVIFTHTQGWEVSSREETMQHLFRCTIFLEQKSHWGGIETLQSFICTVCSGKKVTWHAAAGGHLQQTLLASDRATYTSSWENQGGDAECK